MRPRAWPNVSTGREEGQRGGEERRDDAIWQLNEASRS